MSRKAIIILSSILVAVAIGVSILLYVLSFRTVTFAIVPENVTIIVYNQDSDQEIARLTQGGTMRLQDGKYSVIPTHNDYAARSIPFTVDGEDMTITVDPDYSSTRLADLVGEEITAVNQLLKQTFPGTINNFTIENGTLYQKGEWYATILQQNSLPGGQQGDRYRVVLKKVDDTWQIAAGPEIVLSAQKFPDVPFAILTDINSR